MTMLRLAARHGQSLSPSRRRKTTTGMKKNDTNAEMEGKNSGERNRLKIPQDFALTTRRNY
jgi:hypothetical protein